MKHINPSSESFDLPDYLLGEVYGPLYSDGDTAFTRQDAEDIAQDLLENFGIGTDPVEICELMWEFMEQDFGIALKGDTNPA